MTSRTWSAFLAFGTVLGTAGCEGFEQMASLRPKLVEAFHAPDVVLTLATVGDLTITLENPFPDIEEQATCRRIAGIRVTKSRIVCRFTREELGEPAPAPTNANMDAARPAVPRTRLTPERCGAASGAHTTAGSNSAPTPPRHFASDGMQRELIA